MLFVVFTICVVLSSVYSASNATVMFSASLDEDASFSVNQMVKFPNVVVNSGNGYDSSTGIFTAPIAGYYVFHVHGLAYRNAGFWFRIYHNDVPRASAHGSSSDSWAMGGNTVGLKVKKYDRIYVRNVNAAAKLRSDGEQHYASFTGYKIGE
ncbi:hypothetical protein BsWGS_03800 [Bradybaena similaris]